MAPGNDKDILRLDDRRGSERHDENGNGSRTIAVRIGEVLNLRVRMKHAITVGGIIGALGLGGYSTTWKQKVDTHIDREVPAGFAQLEVVKGDVQTLKDWARKVDARLEQQQRDQIEQWWWEARQARDAGRAERLSRRLLEMDREGR